MVKNLLTMQETRVHPWVGRIPWRSEWQPIILANIHSRILAWRIPWTEEPGRLQSMGSQGVGHD